MFSVFLLHSLPSSSQWKIQWRWMRIAAHRGGRKSFLSIWCVWEMLNAACPECGGRRALGVNGWNGEFTCQNTRKIMASEFIQFRTFFCSYTRSNFVPFSSRSSSGFFVLFFFLEVKSSVMLCFSHLLQKKCFDFSLGNFSTDSKNSELLAALDCFARFNK